jgi:hypothetical protein
MAKKRLTYDVEERLHSLLKKEAAERNLSMGALCSSLLEGALANERKEAGGLDPSSYAGAPLDQLRAEALRLAEVKGEGWESCVRKINLEIVKRYKIQ